MGLILIPSEITGLVSQVKSYVESSVSSYTDARQAVSEYVDNNGLDTEAWNASKSTMHVCYQAITDGMLLAQESINSDLDTLEGSVGTEDLFEDELDAQIKRLQAEIQTYEKCIKLWNRYLGMLFGAFDGSISSKISAYENLIKTNEGLIKELQEKIIFLHEVEDVTSNLFQSSNILIAMVRNAVNDGGVVISGGKPSTNPVWLNAISDAVQKGINPVEAALEAGLAVLSSLQASDKVGIAEIDSNMEGVLIPPQPGETITISRGRDRDDETAVVSKYNSWDIEYSIEGCNTEFPGESCCKRLNYAVENYECNSTDNDLLMFNLEGYDEVVFAGAMVEGYADIGDIVQVTLDDDSSFHFLILDVKNIEHTSDQLREDQCQCEWGHGHMLDENKVQLAVCEFIVAGTREVDSAKFAKSGGFLKDRRVVSAQIVDSIPIGD